MLMFVRCSSDAVLVSRHFCLGIFSGSAHMSSGLRTEAGVISERRKSLGTNSVGWICWSLENYYSKVLSHSWFLDILLGNWETVWINSWVHEHEIRYLIWRLYFFTTAFRNSSPKLFFGCRLPFVLCRDASVMFRVWPLGRPTFHWLVFYPGVS